jgi:hypothetical protein
MKNHKIIGPSALRQPAPAVKGKAGIESGSDFSRVNTGINQPIG